MSASMFDVSNRAKLSRPPGNGGGTEDLLSSGCDDIDPLSFPLPFRSAASCINTLGVSAPLTTGLRWSGCGVSSGFWLGCDVGESSGTLDEDAFGDEGMSIDSEGGKKGEDGLE